MKLNTKLQRSVKLIIADLAFDLLMMWALVHAIKQLPVCSWADKVSLVSFTVMFILFAAKGCRATYRLVTRVKGRHL